MGIRDAAADLDPTDTIKHGSDEDREALRNLDPYEFEHFVADLFEAQGWQTQVTPEENDRGVDIEAWKHDGLFEEKIAIQAKCYSKSNWVGRPEVQRYLALREQDPDVDAVVVVTTGWFSNAAREWSDELNIKLIDVDRLFRSMHELECQDLLEEYTEVAKDTSNLEKPSLKEDSISDISAYYVRRIF